MDSLARRAQIAATLLFFGIAGVAQAADVVINNGASNTFADATHAADIVHLRNAGCPPLWPAGSADDPCPTPGAPTDGEILTGGTVQGIEVLDSSFLSLDGGAVGPVTLSDNAAATMLAGVVSGDFTTADLASFTMLGGAISGDLVASDQASVVLSGGGIGGTLRALDPISSIFILGSNFQVDGSPVPFGPILSPSGTLTGVLASGDPIANPFFHLFGPASGVIILAEAGGVPGMGLVGQFGLIASLLGVGLRTRLWS